MVLVVGLVTWSAIARIMRSQAPSVRQSGFAAAARGFGGRPGHLRRQRAA